MVRFGLFRLVKIGVSLDIRALFSAERFCLFKFKVQRQHVEIIYPMLKSFKTDHFINNLILMVTLSCPSLIFEPQATNDDLTRPFLPTEMNESEVLEHALPRNRGLVVSDEINQGGRNLDKIHFIQFDSSFNPSVHPIFILLVARGVRQFNWSPTGLQMHTIGWPGGEGCNTIGSLGIGRNCNCFL